MELLIVIGRPNEKDAAGGYHGPSVILASGVAHPFFHQLRKLTEGYFPHDLSRIQVDRIQSAPGRFDGRVAIRVKKLVIAVNRILEVNGRRGRRFPGDLCIFSRCQIVGDGTDCLSFQMREAGHPPASLDGDSRDFGRRVLFADTDERREFGRGPSSVFAVTGGAILQIQALSTRPCRR